MTQAERRLQPGQAEASITKTHSNRFCHDLNAGGGLRAFSKPPLNEEPVLAGRIAYAAAIVAESTGVNHEALMLAHAITRAANGWPVFPLRGKAPAIPNPHPKDSPERKTCKGDCGLDGHGVLDATLDITKICEWWCGPYRGANIGGRVPAGLFVLDGDPRKEGHRESYRALLADHTFQPTLMTISGRLDGGWHRFYRHPGGKLSTARLGKGFDIKDSAGYVVLPPSIHPDSGHPYIEVGLPISDPDPWLVEMLRPAPKPPQPRIIRPTGPSNSITRFFGSSIADDFSGNTTWAEILEPHGWCCSSGSGDDDGSVWLHPTHTSNCSATTRYGLLFVYSTSTPFEITGAGETHGYTRFAAYAVLNHGGDMSAAARALRQLKKVR
jgi:hypothetical protein